MKKKLLLFVPLTAIIGFSFLYKGNNITTYHSDGITGVDFSSNPPSEKTGAPGDGNCTQCHSGSVLDAEGSIDFTVSGGPNYVPGSAYPITISSFGGSVKNGFEMTIVDADGNQAGTFTAGDNSGVTVAADREYIRHTASDGISMWTFTWNAPAVEQGELTVFYAYNKSNDNGASSGDEIYLGSKTIPLLGASVKENKLEKGYSIYFNSNTRELNLNYSLFADAKVVLNIQDLSGRLVDYYDLGMQSSGDYTEHLPVKAIDKEGVYLLSLFVNNTVLSRKIVLK